MPWCVRTVMADGVTRYHDPAPTRRESIEWFCALHDLDWREARRDLYAAAVRMELFPPPTTDSGRLALAVLYGDEEAARVLADLVLESYHAVNQNKRGRICQPNRRDGGRRKAARAASRGGKP